MSSSGTNWELRTSVIDLNIAVLAGQQALMLSAGQDEVAKSFRPGDGNWPEDRLSVYTVDVTAGVISRLTVDYPELMKVYERTEASTRNDLGLFFINSYPPFGYTPRHQDVFPGARATSAISVLGEARVTIEDPGTGEVHEDLALNPGDELFFDNSVPLAERPFHVVRNTLAMQRVSITNG